MRALISVSNKSGIVDFSRELSKLGIEIISTGGTAAQLKDEGIKVTGISEVTGFPECLDGRVKTLHPSIHGGLLAIRNNKNHMEQIERLNIKPIDMVVVNLYPFKETILKEGVTLEEAIENIDIGGPTMLRSAAKNYQDVIVIVDPADYGMVLEQLKINNTLSQETKFYLASKVFQHTAAYDALIADYLLKQQARDEMPEKVTLTFEKVQDMRYGENPHQKAAFYQEIGKTKGYLNSAIQLHGKELSFNNINDTNGALELLKEFDEPTVVACKHANPCGVGSGADILEAYKKAYEADPVSIYGGIVVANREIDEDVAEEINKIFVEIIVAPSFTARAIETLSKKKNIRILQITEITERQSKEAYDIKKVGGGLLIQTIDSELLIESQMKVVTKRQPEIQEMEDLIFAWKIVKHAKSNGIVIAKDKQSIGVGPGQVSRIWACKQAIEHGVEYFGRESLTDSVMASDAFFPFADSIEQAVQSGIRAIIQPGGSVRDDEVIDACNQANIAMIFTGMRHFKH
ncbi:MAG: bifunctional phosphoribosylaminoimidazolecarboxamide formyltransferase/IMP cyclohydrolase [Tissierellales bacterium]|nr:bifunctional phosphoribosylaminoimidazolecarboxamide formyltransferase/IMP cyclohydrolase [Tissierellales bacterium]MBN2827414.1 bifunctional phosphoribosylaminoimidazolecarboxamide formyltransferase/IMP cyclohydrolase [Tissierellales bacterium]